MTQTSSGDAVLAALSEMESEGSEPAIAADIAERAGLGRSTTTKALAALAGEGRVERTPGGRHGGRARPDTWTLPAGSTVAVSATDADKRTEAAKSGGRGRAAKGAAQPAASRLGRGELADLVLGWMIDHPGQHSPTAVAKGLDGRSSGAVSNALARLTHAGHLAQTSTSPRRYRAAKK
jgi:hypothetical protein